jgi:hypothetical protein
MNTFASRLRGTRAPHRFVRRLLPRGGASPFLSLARASLACLAAGLLAAACGGGDSGTSAGTSANAQAAAVANAAATPSLKCGSASAATSAASSSNLIAADTPGSDGTRMFPLNTSFQIAFTTQATKKDTLKWQITDDWSTVRASGSFAVAAGAKTVTLTCSSSLAGYFAIGATLSSEGGTLPSLGTRPAGIATFGILPNVSSTVPAVGYAHQDQHRFGGQGTTYIAPGQTCCSGDGYRPLYTDLGLSWANDNRNWYIEEPNGPNPPFVPGTNTLATYFQPGDLMRLILLDGIPCWAAPSGTCAAGATFEEGYAPASLSTMQSYMNLVGTDSALIRAAYFPNQTSNYYQVTWEPDAGGPTQWLDTQTNFVALYQAVYNGIHATDPNAVVMGVTDSFVTTNIAWLQTYAPLGLTQYLDGLTIHGYYDAGTSPSHPPERLATDSDPAVAANALPQSMRNLRAAMVQYLQPGAKLFVTETGISYDLGTSYGPNYPTANVLFAHGAVVARAQLILLGEGANMTYMFYAVDIPDSPPGYGITFDLNDPDGAAGAGNISPKPAALELAAMTRIIDGTNTLGYLSNVPSGVYAYAFQQLNGGKVITALWTHNNAVWSASVGFSETYSVNYSLKVDSPGTSGSVTILDAMGNASTQSYKNGALTLKLTESPIYVVSTNAAVAQANVTTPTGYVGQ